MENQEEINRRQIEDTKKRDAEVVRLQQEIKREKERQGHGARTQQDRETRKRLKREDLSFRNQAERLNGAQDGSYCHVLGRYTIRTKVTPLMHSTPGSLYTRHIPRAAY